MSRRGRLIAGLAALALVAVIAVAGGYNVAASSGHLPWVKPLLAWTLKNSVFWRSLDEAPPGDAGRRPLPTSGAGHYHLVCRQCHGTPEEPVPESMRNMVPPPPHALDAVRHWRPRELFWIIKHGIKMTAMPSWPAQHRDDEVWEVVAFMRRLPDMDPAAYARAVGDGIAEMHGPEELQETLGRCARCHGMDGTGPARSDVPIIAGLGETYLREALDAYRRGNRASGFMQVQAAGLSAQQIAALARHFSRQTSDPGPPDMTPTAAKPSMVEAGRRIARDGVRERRIPACAACHGPSESLRAEEYPTLAGQRPGYLRKQLELFRRGTRGGSEFASLMAFAASELTDQDIEALAAYYGSLRNASD